MSAFDLYPAIDLHQGRVVRLVQGDLARQKTYGDDPVEFARRWFAAGANWIHVVNLDGAFEQAEDANLTALHAILAMRQKEFPHVRIQFGGGVRSLEMIRQVLDVGVNRVILGTLLAKGWDLVEQAVRVCGADALAAAMDVLNGYVSIRGWVEQTDLTPLALGSRLTAAGIKTVIYTDITRDGTGKGANLETAQSLAHECGAHVILSGGIASLEEISRARAAGMAGVIIGRALYEGAFTLKEALEV
ncbi:MAG: 1-(5-phosphoribosyl)-5-[(5-phosphoribosylamino)methylideneamino]imidazole-4-carboxamide isomerase [Anaerolineaceae bacterium]